MHGARELQGLCSRDRLLQTSRESQLMGGAAGWGGLMVGTRCL